MTGSRQEMFDEKRAYLCIEMKLPVWFVSGIREVESFVKLSSCKSAMHSCQL